jgi:hypothetical protein
MPIKPREPPQDAYEQVRKVIEALAAGRAFRTPNLARANPDPSALGTPHRVAILPLDSLRQERGALEVVLQGWRWFLRDADGRPVGTAEAIAVGDSYRFGELNEGPFVASTEEALRRVEQIDLGPWEFEPLLLVAPAIYVAALWLKRQPGDAGLVEEDDVLVLLPPLPASLEPYDRLTPEKWDLLRQLAGRVPSDRLSGG